MYCVCICTVYVYLLFTRAGYVYFSHGIIHTRLASYTHRVQVDLTLYISDFFSFDQLLFSF